MASFNASMLQKFGDRYSTVCGTFGNISIDGRYSEQNATIIAREHFKREAKHKKCEYIGFIIERTSRPFDYKNPKVQDSIVHLSMITY